MVTFAQFSFYICFSWFFRIIFRPHIAGIEHIPGKPFVLVANHPSRIDPFVLCLLPFKAVTQLIPIYFLTAERYYRKWYLRPFLYALGSYPVSPRAWTLDGFLSSTAEKLNTGKTVMFFPEGKVVREERLKPKLGIGYLINQTQTPILPLHITWTTGSRIRKKLTLVFGKPVVFTIPSKSKDFQETIAQKVMEIVYSL